MSAPFALSQPAFTARRRHCQASVLLAAWTQLQARFANRVPSVRHAASAARLQCSWSSCTTMSDEIVVKWKAVAKAIRSCLEHNKTKQNMASDDWQLFLDNLKRDTSIVSRLHKLLGVRRESKNGEFRDSANSRFQNFCQNKELIREKNVKKRDKRRKH